MNIGVILCLSLALFCLLLGLFFKVMKGKAARYISGFSSYTKEEQNKYDLDRMSKDNEKLYFQLCLIMIIGACFSIFNSWISLITLIVWFIRFFKEVHLDDEKAFGKYRKNV